MERISLNFRTHENIPQLKQDIQALEEVSRHLFLEAHDLQNMRERNEWSQTWQVRAMMSHFCFVKFLILPYSSPGQVL